jgi:hypothetical protein
MGELLVLAFVGVIVALGFEAALVWSWLLGHFVAGVVLGYRFGGRRRGLAAILAGALIGSAIAGGMLALAVALGVVPPELAPSSETFSGSIILGTILGVAFLGVPVVFLGVVIGTVPVFVRRNRRRRAIAQGAMPPLVAAGPLDMRLEVKRPLDAVALTAATADGAATRVVLIYRGAGADAQLAHDRLRLAAMGYALTGVDRRPPRAGIGWALLRLAGAIVGVIVAFSWHGLGDVDPFGGLVAGRVTATFDLQSPTHEPLLEPEIET